MKTNRLIAAALIASLSLFSCKKETAGQASPDTVPVATQHVARWGECTPANDANQYDNTGQLHNDGLNIVLPNATFGNYNISDDQLFANAADWCMNTFGAVPPNMEANAALCIQDQPGHYSNIIDQANASDIAKSYAHMLANGLFDTESYPDPEAISYCDVKSRIVAYEKTVSTANDLTAGEKQMLLQCASIARYSVYYGWQHESANPPVTNTDVQYLRIILAACADWSSFWSSWGDLGTAVATSCVVYKYAPF